MDLTGWTPTRVRAGVDHPIVQWRWTGSVRFDDPFFEQTIARCTQKPFSMVFPLETSVQELDAALRAEPGLEPAGFIFHLSRCGSTLVSQMLAASPHHRVISEPAPLEQLLRLRLQGVSDDALAPWLRVLVNVLGRPLRGEQVYVLKLDSWSTVDIPLLESVFPGVPWVFVYRDPIEVLASHLRQAGPQVIPGVLPPELLGLEWSSLETISLEEYAARALARIASAALAALESGRGMLVEYGELPQAVVERVCAHFGIAIDEVTRDTMTAAAGRDAKNPVVPFVPDAERKRAEISPAGRAAAEQWLRPVYDELERARLRGEATC